ncbi:type VI secretion system protein [Janthinobacterium sp. PC23-8]|uniref:type VI secretion system protein n=1 Tax=Janthinobacterium sp. PC23-8 TaxID=2012679 RepID=UPI000B9663B5|nr:type VI secretion system protein [Janthinobacterium sp. PC23-8]OYO27458.1 hypothetical protein CD932_19955 [Janthinobacterium sp. PC23-8]
MGTVFQFVAAAALLAGLLAACLVWRARRPVAPQPVCCGEPLPDTPAPPSAWRKLARALDFLRTRREWRYRQPWLLVLGQQGAGKSSLLASLAAHYRRLPQGREKQLAIAGCTWQFAGSGSLIDAPGAWMTADAAGQSGKAAMEWRRVLGELDALRPERALDGLLLVVSAATLQAATLAERDAMAAGVTQQLRSIAQRFEFALPVYVVISQSDAVAGFGAFWRAQPLALRQEMVGWSAPGQSGNGLPRDWANCAFDYVGAQLKALQMQAAVHCEQIAAADLDPAFLFPRHLQQLRAPFTHWLTAVFQPEPWQAGLFCRGIYFTGAVGGAPAPDGARDDVAFIDHLLVRKALAERGLARPTRQGLWSRNATIGLLQRAAAALLLALLVLQLLSVLAIRRQVSEVVAALSQLQQIEQPLAAGPCAGQAAALQVIERIAAIDAEAGRWTIPVSLVDTRLVRKSARQLADGALRHVVMPALACQLRQRADALLASATTGAKAADAGSYAQARSAMFAYIDQLEQFERNTVRFNRLGGNAPYPAGALPLSDFTALASYAFGQPLPAALKVRAGLLPAVLAYSRGNAPLAVPDTLRQSASEHIVRQAQVTHRQLDQELRQGGVLLGKLDKFEEPLLAHTRELTRWLNWVGTAWLGSSLERNPIAAMRGELAQRLDPLKRLYGYAPAPLDAASEQFDAARQYPGAMRTLAEMQLPVYGPLFTEQDSSLRLNPALSAELGGLDALLGLGFMQATPNEALACNPTSTGWSTSQLGMAATYAQEYEKFAATQALAPLTSAGGAAARPLYDRLARHQLELVLNDNVTLAQLAATPGAAQAGVGYTAPAELLIDKRSASFARAVQPLLGLQRTYAELGFASRLVFAQCTRNFASSSLGQIQSLAEQGQLYQPPATPSSGAAGRRDAPFFDLGGAPEVKDYLARQSERATVLAQYAAPFVSFLLNADTPGAPGAPGTQGLPYWANTIDALSLYAQKDSSSQVVSLDSLIAKQLPGMSGANCGPVLAAYTSPAAGNDLFSLRRQHLEQQIKLRCKGVREMQGYDAYQAWALRFNQELAGRYPFGPLDSNDGAAPVVRKFFSDYGAGRAELRQKLDGLNDRYWDQARAFLDQLDAAAAFFGATLVGQDGAEPAAIKLGLSFRARPGDSPLSNQIVRWKLRSGMLLAGMPNLPTSIDWQYGQPLSASFEWASESSLRPLKDGAQPDLRIDGAVATYGASGEWALLRLIDSHRPDKGDGTPYQMQFRMPVSGASQPAGAGRPVADLYINLTLSSGGKTPASLKIPRPFPRSAPH